MNRERIERAIEILKLVPAGKFDLGEWAVFKPKELEGLASGSQVALNGCGTSGCAMGWVASDKRCIAEGLYLRAGAHPRLAVPTFHGSGGFDAAQRFFELDTFSDVQNLFHEGSYDDCDVTNPLAVVERLQRLLDTGSPL